jgi:hypothetical protein
LGSAAFKNTSPERAKGTAEKSIGALTPKAPAMKEPTMDATNTASV